jgi:hypothetical protein
MNIFTLEDNDIVEISKDEIQMNIGGKAFCFKIVEISKIAILTSDQGPFVDDVALAVTIEDRVFVIPSENKLYEKFLFDGISKKITIDFQKVMEASSCTENAEFIIYHKY